MACRVLLTGLLLMGSACVTPRAQTSPAESISAGDLLHAYWNSPADAVERFRNKPIELTGLIERSQEVNGRPSALDLQTDERSYYVRCWLTAEAAVVTRRFDRGQLVAVRGTGADSGGDAPELRDCEVIWQGDRPGSRSPEYAKQALATAHSLTVCAEEGVLLMLETARLDRAVLLREQERAAARIRDSRALLEKSGARPLPCNHPFLAIVSRCARNRLLRGLSPAPIVEGNRIFVDSAEAREERVGSSECASEQVVDALEQLANENAPEEAPAP